MVPQNYRKQQVMVNFVRELSAVEKPYDMEQHLGQKLLYSTLELEELKAEASEEMRKNKEYVNQLIHLLKLVIQERDEARNQLQKLLNKTIYLPTTPQTFPNVPLIQSDSPLFKANSSATESNTLLDAYNYQSRGSSSPVESLLDPVSSPEFSSINLVVNHLPLDQDPKPSLQTRHVDRDSMIIDNLVRGRSLPQKGKFLEAVLEAGPLLHTLLVAGPLPRWRNPPQIQSFQVPHILIKGDHGAYGQKQASNVGQFGSGHPQIVSAPMLNFSNMSHETCSSNGRMLPSRTNASGHFPLEKRQRLC